MGPFPSAPSIPFRSLVDLAGLSCPWLLQYYHTVSSKSGGSASPQLSSRKSEVKPIEAGRRESEGEETLLRVRERTLPSPWPSDPQPMLHQCRYQGQLSFQRASVRRTEPCPVRDISSHVFACPSIHPLPSFHFPSCSRPVARCSRSASVQVRSRSSTGLRDSLHLTAGSCSQPEAAPLASF